MPTVVYTCTVPQSTAEFSAQVAKQIIALYDRAAVGQPAAPAVTIVIS